MSNCSSGKPNVCLPLSLTGCLCSYLSSFPSTYSLLCGSRPVKEHLTTGLDVRQSVSMSALYRLPDKKEGKQGVGRYEGTHLATTTQPKAGFAYWKNVFVHVNCVLHRVLAFLCLHVFAFSAAVLASPLTTVCFSNDSLGSMSICSRLYHKPQLDVLKCDLSVCRRGRGSLNVVV